MKELIPNPVCFETRSVSIRKTPESKMDEIDAMSKFAIAVERMGILPIILEQPRWPFYRTILDC